MSDSTPPPPENPYGGAPGTPYGTPYGTPGGYPPPPPPPPGYPQGYGYGGLPPEHPQATTILTLGIVSIVAGVIGCMCCAILGLIGLAPLIMGRKAEKEILASGGALGGASKVRTGWILGAVAVGLSGLSILLGIVMVATMGVDGILGGYQP